MRGSSSPATGTSQASSTSNRPSSPDRLPASSRAVATPQLMLEPARFRTTAPPSRSTAAASIEAVVVFPFVAETSTAPPWSRFPR